MLKAWEVTFTATALSGQRTMTCLTDEVETFPTYGDFARMIEIRTGRAGVKVLSWVQVPH